MKTTMSSKGQIVLPAEIRNQDGIAAGEEFDIERIEAGEYRLKRRARPRNKGLVDLLLACPVKDWFLPMERRETTDDIRAPRVG
jgi:AbrB family looped-hinge helix DNA binding protein